MQQSREKMKEMTGNFESRIAQLYNDCGSNEKILAKEHQTAIDDLKTKFDAMIQNNQKEMEATISVIKLEAEKERIEKEADAQYWRDFREKAQYQPEPVDNDPATYGIDTGEQGLGDILSEGWSEAQDTVSGWFEGDDEDEGTRGSEAMHDDGGEAGEVAGADRMACLRATRPPGL